MIRAVAIIILHGSKFIAMAVASPVKGSAACVGLIPGCVEFDALPAVDTFLMPPTGAQSSYERSSRTAR